MEIDRSRLSQPSSPPLVEEGEAAPASEDVAYWEGLERTDEFRQLITARMRFVLPATAFFLVYYFLLPLANGLAPGFMRTDVIGHVYIRKANSVFDRFAAMVRERAARGRRTTP